MKSILGMPFIYTFQLAIYHSLGSASNIALTSHQFISIHTKCHQLLFNQIECVVLEYLNLRQTSWKCFWQCELFVA